MGGIMERSNAMPWKKTKGGYKLSNKKNSGVIKRPKQYEALRRKGMSKTAAARIANAKRRKRKK